jgi:2-haloacid dehalogenase
VSRVILFDVNGTLLDVQALAPELDRLFGGAVSVREWFSEVLQYSLALTLTGDYAELGEVAAAVLKMTAFRLGCTIDDAGVATVKHRLTSLPPFPDVKPALTVLKAAGFRMAILTNSSAESLETQLGNAELTGFFERAVSVDRVRRYKPAPETYQFAAQALHVRPSDLLLVAAHGWDVFGATRAGCRAAFISRPGQAVFPIGPKPDYFVQDLTTLARQIAEIQR